MVVNGIYALPPIIRAIAATYYLLGTIFVGFSAVHALSYIIDGIIRLIIATRRTKLRSQLRLKRKGT